MTRKHLMLLLPILALLLLGGLWAFLRPEGSSLLPIIGREDGKSSPKVEVDPIDLDDPDGKSGGDIASPRDNSGGGKGGGELEGLTEEEREAARVAREEARIEAERLEAEGIDPETGQPRPGTEGKGDDDTRPIRSLPTRELTEEEQALQKERQRRIEQLKRIKRPPNQSLGNHRPRTRKLKQEFGKKDLSEVTPELKQDRRGLFAKYYAFQQSPIEALLDPEQPTLDQRTPDVTRIDPQVHFPSKEAWADLPFDKRNFMGVWEGFLVIEEDADYWLYIGADYTARVVLSGETVLLNDMRDYTEVSTVLTLSKGLHPIRIEYMEGENGSVVDPLGACNFMWVPEGESKPVPVPPEMLMLPEHLWSDGAPIITKVSATEGEIGDEITISGQSFDASESEKESGFKARLRVTFSGQEAAILQSDESSLKVRVPIGATTGKLIVFRSIVQEADAPDPTLGTVEIPSIEIPSNSIDFTVTTQFGLFASWHNLEGWSNYDFIDDSMHEPDLVRLEREFMFETRDELDLAFRNNPLACHWEGKLGIPAGWVEGEMALVRFQTYGRLRVKLGDELKETAAATGQGFNLTTVDFEVRNKEEHYLTLSIDWTSESGPASLTVAKMIPNVIDDNSDTVPVEQLGNPWQMVETLQSQLFFPPVVPPKPPQILSAKPIYAEGEQPPTLPYERLTERPSIREGQLFEFNMEVFGNAEVLAAPVNITVDGMPLEYTVTQTETGNGGGVIRTCQAVLPGGLGEGAIVARLTVVTSEPFYIDVLNKGLIAYLYDLPNPGGYQTMPDPEPLACFQVRKDAQVNFENANDFDLPFPAETFAVEWFGALIIEQEGDYRFTCRSDDGILVWLDGNLVVEDDNLHYQREKSGDWVHLVPGVYKFRMQFFENNVHEVCVLEWEAREDSEDDQTEFLERQVIGKRHFTWDEHPALPAKTSTYKRADGSDPE